MNQKSKVAVLIHGCHLQADLNGKTWEEIVWGDKKRATLEGRGTMGLKIAMEHDANLIIFSTGASEREGMKEGEMTYRYALLRSEYIADAIGCTEQEVRSFVSGRGQLDLESQNTREECERNLALCISLNINRIILVSSPWHIQRCLTEALKVAETMRNRGEMVPSILAASSYGGTEGIVILEPSHRGDQPKNTFAALAARFFKVPVAHLAEFQNDVHLALHKYNI